MRLVLCCCGLLFCKQKTAYEMRISDWSSDVCSSVLIAALESRLGVRLLNRSSRRFSVTEVGQEFYRHCVAMLVEAEAAEQARSEVRRVGQECGSTCGS